ncbi:Uncharacterised protein [Yersinia intermedia]|uniref:hypothetical protein n=1 Tax=Yersinia intermedia TaxID=631 RepID=UPI0005E0743D|nr:hypothetical protein [Yersinia intermedia]CQD76516.1 Uncharacterised protein [Yersinia intermedia]
MLAEWFKWILGVATSTGILCFTAFLMRTTLSRFFTKSVEYQFEKKFEKFKADIRDNEKELEQVRNFLVLARRERDSALQLKRFEAAETMMRARQTLSELAPIVEYVKNLNTDEMMKRGDDPKIAEFIDALIKPFNIDEKLKAYGEIDKTLSRLYLSDRSQKIFEAYENIVLHAVMIIKMLRIPLGNKPELIKKGSLSKIIIEMVPSSKEGIETYGEGHVFYWSNYFYVEILKELRNELLGTANMSRDTEAATRLAVDSRLAHLDIRSSLKEHGLSDTLLRPDANAEVG